MKVLVNAEILTVGIEKFSSYLQKLPVRLTNFADGKKAVSSLKNANFNAVISRWNLDDMPDGKLLRGLKLIKPDLYTVAVVETDNFNQEIAARSTGVNAVVSNNIDPEELNRIISDLIHIPNCIPQSVVGI